MSKLAEETMSNIKKFNTFVEKLTEDIASGKRQPRPSRKGKRGGKMSDSEFPLNSQIFPTIGYWWWREGGDERWELAKVISTKPLKVRFFDGSIIDNLPRGIWEKAEVKAI